MIKMICRILDLSTTVLENKFTNFLFTIIMNTKILNYLLLCTTTLLMACSAPKEILYLQDISLIKEEPIDKNYEVIIHKDDLLAIIVNSKDPELALPFNMPLISYEIGSQNV